jgi:serine phosphatase RsbU (regulator of sigma subunit)
LLFTEGEAISGDLREERFVTFVAVVCSPGNSRVGLLSAGHGPLIMCQLKEDRFDKQDAQALPLGISPVLVSDPPLIGHEIISTIYQAVVEFSGGTKQQDDLTAVIIKRK